MGRPSIKRVIWLMHIEFSMTTIVSTTLLPVKIHRVDLIVVIQKIVRSVISKLLKMNLASRRWVKYSMMKPILVESVLLQCGP